VGSRKSSVPGGPRPGKKGPPPFEPTPEQVETAKHLLGRQQYPSKAARSLVRKFGFTPANAYRTIERARQEAVDALAGQGHDPMGAMFLFLESVIADGTQPMQYRLNAAANVIRMLGLDRLLKKMDSGGVEAYLAKLAAAPMAAGMQTTREGGVEAGFHPALSCFKVCRVEARPSHPPAILRVQKSPSVPRSVALTTPVLNAPPPDGLVSALRLALADVVVAPPAELLNLAGHDGAHQPEQEQRVPRDERGHVPEVGGHAERPAVAAEGPAQVGRAASLTPHPFPTCRADGP
jgi:hypothetical protein